MSTLDQDPFINAVHRGIKRDIDIVIKNQSWRAAILLIYAGIDAMAFTTLAAGKLDVQRGDFIAWAGKYIRFPGPEQVTGEELYAARCAVLHTYGTESKMSREGRCRVIIHAVGGGPIWVKPEHPDAVGVEVMALRDAFFKAIEDYAHEVSTDADRWPIVEARFAEFMHEIPM